MILMENLTHIQVFKTNIRSEDDKTKISSVLAITEVKDWSVDNEDIDCVLRVVSYELTADEIIKLINKTGFQCRELE